MQQLFVKVKFVYIKQNQEKTVEMTVLKTLTVQQLIKLFLEETNSKLDANSDKICFQYGIRILNDPLYFNRTLSSLKIRDNHIIRVNDIGNIIGGKNLNILCL